jgi:hypothetical protein
MAAAHERRSADRPSDRLASNLTVEQSGNRAAMPPDLARNARKALNGMSSLAR